MLFSDGCERGLLSESGQFDTAFLIDMPKRLQMFQVSHVNNDKDGYICAHGSD